MDCCRKPSKRFSRPWRLTKRGTVNFATLLDAQRTIRDVRLGYYKAIVEYEQSIADLERAVGKKLS